jgi:hypothetical protein
MAGYIVAAWHSTDWALLISRRLVCSAVKFPPHVRIEVAAGRLGFDQRRDRLIWHVAVVVPRAPEPDQQVPVLVVVAHSPNEAAFDGGAFEGIEAQGAPVPDIDSSASAEGANNIKAAKVTVRDLEGTEDSINHSSAAAASAPVKPQIGIDPASSDRGSFYPPVRMRMEPQLKDADYRIQIV